MAKGTEVIVSRIPACDINAAHGNAVYDGKTRMGSWAFMCQQCFDLHGIGLGTGKGQKLIRQDMNNDET